MNSIREQLDALDQHKKEIAAEQMRDMLVKENGQIDSESTTSSNHVLCRQFSLGARQQLCTLDHIEETHWNDVGFKDF